MLPSSEKSNVMATISWIIVGGFLLSEEPSILIAHSRLLVFFTIISFWYGLSLYIRRQKYKSQDGKTYYEALRYLGSVWFHWNTVLAFGIFLIPTTFLTILGIFYAITGALSKELSMLITINLWIVFFTFESTHSQGKIFSTFYLSELNWFVVSGIFLDVAGLIFSIIEIAS